MMRPPLGTCTALLFALGLTAVYAAVGVGALVGPLLRRRRTVPLGLAVVAGAAVLLVPAAVRAAQTPIPGASVREQVDYVRAHRRPGDAVAVSFGASFAFAYYWPDRPTFGPATTPTAVRFEVDYPGRPDLVVAHFDDPASVQQVLDRTAGRGRPTWIVLGLPEQATGEWGRKAAKLGRVTGPAGRLLPLLVQPGHDRHP
jgi:hypothetical protein